MVTIQAATDFLKGIKPGARVSLLDPHDVNSRNEWQALHVLEGEQPTLPYVPVCRDMTHTRIYMRVWVHTGFIANLCACELAAGRKWIATWDMPADAKHVMSATGFEDRETSQTWQSTRCGVLLETTDGRRPYKDGHLTYPTPTHWHKITCPGCAMREGKDPEAIEGVTVFGSPF
ncbi:hypothetical protein ACLGIH_20440 [Streptomyces sp. HMX87]|uniref:hypothetical protein n=1 Tax=Streptomyces sp. HMX87 TaxID=3390849 RepID=UPI003A8A28EA